MSGYKVLRFEDTPNPNAVKCILDRRISDVPRSFLSAADAADDPLIAAIFEIPGIRNVLTLDDWITIGKFPDAPWSEIRRRISEILREGGSADAAP